MKKHIYTGLFLLGMFSVNAQSKATAKADKHFDNLEYVDAISDYLKVVEKEGESEYVQSRLADTYYNVFNTIAAEEWYSKVVSTSQNKEHFFKYAQMLKANGNYDKANQWMDKFANLAPTDVRAISHKKNPNTVVELLGDTPKFTVKPVEGFNTKYSEFGPIMHEGQVYYTAAHSGKSKKYGWNEEPYLDIYVSDYDAASGTLTNESEVLGKVNTKFNEGTVSFSPDGKTMYFSGESLDRDAGLFGKKFKKDDSGKSTINVYSTTLSGGEWTNVTTLPFNTENSSASGPAVSADGKRLYFNSDMEGTLGGADLWYVTINEGGTYGEPVNLGTDINTEGSEKFPYVSSKNILYFSSNGHPGLGMMDVFATKMIGNNFGSVRNVGAPLNSGNDDFSFTIDEELQKGFFASNRAGGAGSDDIYMFDQIIPICEVVLTVQVVDSRTGVILQMASVDVFDSENVKVASKISDENGEIQFKYECDQAFRVEASKETYTSNSVAVEKTSEKSIAKTVVLEAPIELKPIFFDLDEFLITETAIVELDKIVVLLQENPQMIIRVESHTDARDTDSHNMELSINRVKASIDYVLSKGIHAHRIYGKGLGETQLVNKCADDVECSEEEHQANRRSEFIIVE